MISKTMFTFERTEGPVLDHTHSRSRTKPIKLSVYIKMDVSPDTLRYSYTKIMFYLPSSPPSSLTSSPSPLFTLPAFSQTMCREGIQNLVFCFTKHFGPNYSLTLKSRHLILVMFSALLLMLFQTNQISTRWSKNSWTYQQRALANGPLGLPGVNSHQ